MHFTTKKWFWLPLLLLSVFAAEAQVKFTASANRTEVGRNEQFKVEFSVNASGNGFTAPDFSNFQVLQGPSRSSSIQIVNFQRNESLSFSYILRPKQTGTYTIGPASIEVNGKTYTSQPLTIKVLNESPRANDPNDPYSIAARSAFIKIIPSKTTVYQGEPFVASYKLYFKTNIGRYSLQDEPDYTGFYREKVELKAISSEPEMYRGERFEAGIIDQSVLIAQRSGSIKPGLLEVQIPTAVPTNKRDFFGRPLSQTINQTSTDNFPTIRVKALPEDNKPSDFSGAVGKYRFDVSLSREELSATESVTLKVTLSGDGNIKLVDAPKPQVPNAFEVYDPEYKESIRVSGSGMQGSKTYEYLLVPRYGGTYKIPPMTFSFFDPQRERYETITSDELEVKVTGGAAQPATSKGMSGGETEKVGFIGKDILFIKTDPGRFTKKGQSYLGSTAFYTIAGLGGAAFAGMLIFFFLVTNRKKDYRRERSQKASKMARKHLAQAKKELGTQNKEAFYQALTSALWGYFSDKFSIPNSKLSKDVIEENLISRGVNTETTERVVAMMNRAEMARFTSTASYSPKEDYEETALLITQIEREV